MIGGEPEVARDPLVLAGKEHLVVVGQIAAQEPVDRGYERANPDEEAEYPASLTGDDRLIGALVVGRPEVISQLVGDDRKDHTEYAARDHVQPTHDAAAGWDISGLAKNRCLSHLCLLRPSGQAFRHGQ